MLTSLGAGFNQTYIQWNSTEGLWHCCGDNGCGQPNSPSGVAFQAVKQGNWSALPSTVTSTMSTATPTSSPASAATSTVSSGTAIESNKSSGDLSTGAQAGIGVGVGVAGAAAISALAFWFRRRRKRIGAKNDAEVQGMMSQKYDEDHPSYLGSPQPKELDTVDMTPAELGGARPAPYELDATRGHSELPGDQGRR